MRKKEEERDEDEEERRRRGVRPTEERGLPRNQLGKEPP
jgi:hypothetical protein